MPGELAAAGGALVKLLPSTLVAVFLAAAMNLRVGVAGAANLSWNSGAGDWSTSANWSPAGPPLPADRAFLGDSAAAENSVVKLDVDATVSWLEMSDGMVLDTNGHAMTVNGQLRVGWPANGNSTLPPRLRVARGDKAADLIVNDFFTVIGAEIELDGGVIEVNAHLQPSSNSRLYGAGIINVNDSSFSSNGLLEAAPGGIVFNHNGSGLISLDGETSLGTVMVTGYDEVTKEHSTLTINSQVLSGFDGTMSIGGGFVAMNLSSSWTVWVGGVINFFGRGDESAKLNGSRVEFMGTANVYGIAEFNAPSQWRFTSKALIREKGELRLDGAAILRGASFKQTDGTAGGVVTNNGGLSVFAATTIDLPTGVFDWDGDGAPTLTSIGSGGIFTLNVDRIENDSVSDPDLAYNGTTSVGLNGVLAVNTTEPWRHAGVIRLGGGRLNGSGVINLNSLEGRGRLSPAFIDNQGSISADGGELIVETAGVSDLDGADGDGVLNAQKGKLKVLGFGSLVEFDGTLNVGLLGVPQEFEMPSGGLDNTGAINLAGGLYRGELRQDGKLSVSFDSTIVSSNGVFGANGSNAINADLRLDGVFAVEQGATFDGAGDVVVLSNSTVRAEDGAAVALRVDNFGVVAPGEGLGEAVGILGVAGYINEEGGRLAIDLLSDGGVAGGGHDLLDIRGEAVLLGGTLEVNFVEGFMPSAGDEFLVLRTLAGVSGAFDHLVQPLLPDVKLAAVYEEFGVRLVAVTIPEPSSITPAVCGVFAVSRGWRGSRAGSLRLGLQK
ncbi:MAG: hypothetical protein C0485_01025 [Pirellula sp.]|nr:hypothetical protein [Pirellula sp.]